MELTERGGRVRHVLEHLHAQRGVELAIAHGQRRGIRFVERHIRLPLERFAATASIVGARVDADDGAVGTHLVEQLRDVEARPAAHVQDPLPRRGSERFADEPAPAQHVAVA